MAKNTSKTFLKIDFLHYFLPVGLLAMVLMWQFQARSELQLQVLIIVGLIYIIGAFIHHHFDKTLTLEVIIEYILIAILALSIVSGAII